LYFESSRIDFGLSRLGFLMKVQLAPEGG